MKELLFKAKENPEARMEIVQAYEPLIKKCIKIYIKDSSYYEDALQQGRLILLGCIKGYDLNSPYPFPAYVKKSLIYGIRDFSRKIKETISLDDPIEDDFSLYDIIPSQDCTEEIISRESVTNTLSRCIASLPDGQRKVIEDFYIKNKTLIEISKNKRCHYMSVVKLKQRGLAALKTMLEAEGLRY